jgi:DNA (cytosine-5)-methyltransferase 1
MGLPEDYRLPPRTTAALHLAGDGVAVPVVRHVAAAIIEPLLTGAARAVAAA